MITGGATCNNYTSSQIRTKVAQEAYYGDRKTATWPSMAASARKVKNGLSPDYRWWLADTGCPYDLVSKDTLPPDALGMMGHSKKGMVIDTCNGQVSTNKTICMQVDELKEQIKPYLLDSTPDVLSIGRRCVKYGYGFHWDPYSLRPFLVSPDGDMIPLEVLDYVPYLADRFNANNAPELNNGTGCPALPSAQFKQKRRKLLKEEQAAFLKANIAVQMAELEKLEVAAPGPAAQAAEPADCIAAAPGPAAQAAEPEELLVQDPPGITSEF
jgi:hypothetical protein